MVIGKLLNLDIAEGDVLEETCWEIAKDEAMALDKVTYYTRNKDELEAYVFQDIKVDKETTYYGRAKYRTKQRGWSDWNNLDIIAVASTEDIGEVKTLPSRLAVPRVETYHYDLKVNTETKLQSEPLEPINHPVIGFAIKADGYSSITGATHVATSYYLEDIERNVIWKSEYNTIDLYVKRVDTVALEDNKAYRARVVFHSSTNDVSDAGTKTFITRRYKDKTISTFLENVLGPNSFFVSETNTFTPPIGDKEIGLELMIMDYSTYGTRIIFSASTTKKNPEIEFKPNILGVDKTYVVLFRIKSWKEGIKIPDDGIPTDDSQVEYGPWGYFVLDTRRHQEHKPTIQLVPYDISTIENVVVSDDDPNVYEMLETSCTFKVGNIVSRRGVSIATTNATSGHLAYPTSKYPLEGTLTLFCNDNFDETDNEGIFSVLLENVGNVPTTLKVKGDSGYDKHPYDKNDLSFYTLSKQFVYDPSLTPKTTLKTTQTKPVDTIAIGLNGDDIEVTTTVEYDNRRWSKTPISFGKMGLQTVENTVLRPMSSWKDYPDSVTEEQRISVAKVDRHVEFDRELNANDPKQKKMLAPGVKHDFYSPFIHYRSFTTGGKTPKRVKFILDVQDKTPKVDPLVIDKDAAIEQYMLDITSQIESDTNPLNGFKKYKDEKSAEFDAKTNTLICNFNLEYNKSPVATEDLNNCTFSLKTIDDTHVIPLTTWEEAIGIAVDKRIAVKDTENDTRTDFSKAVSNIEIGESNNYIFTDEYTSAKIDPACLIYYKHYNNQPLTIKFKTRIRQWNMLNLDNDMFTLTKLFTPRHGVIIKKEDFTFEKSGDGYIGRARVEYRGMPVDLTPPIESVDLKMTTPKFKPLRPVTNWKDFKDNTPKHKQIEVIDIVTNEDGTPKAGSEFRIDANTYGYNADNTQSEYKEGFNKGNYEFTSALIDNNVIYNGGSNPKKVKFVLDVIDCNIDPIDFNNVQLQGVTQDNTRITLNNVDKKVEGNVITFTGKLEYQKSNLITKGLSSVMFKFDTTNDAPLKPLNSDTWNAKSSDGKVNQAKTDVNTVFGLEIPTSSLTGINVKNPTLHLEGTSDQIDPLSISMSKYYNKKPNEPMQVKFLLDIVDKTPKPDPIDPSPSLYVNSNGLTVTSSSKSLSTSGNDVVYNFTVNYEDGVPNNKGLQEITATSYSGLGLILDPNTSWNDNSQSNKVIVTQDGEIKNVFKSTVPRSTLQSLSSSNSSLTIDYYSPYLKTNTLQGSSYHKPDQLQRVIHRFNIRRKEMRIPLTVKPNLQNILGARFSLLGRWVGGVNSYKDVSEFFCLSDYDTSIANWTSYFVENAGGPGRHRLSIDINVTMGGIQYKSGTFDFTFFLKSSMDMGTVPNNYVPPMSSHWPLNGEIYDSKLSRVVIGTSQPGVVIPNNASFNFYFYSKNWFTSEVTRAFLNGTVTNSDYLSLVISYKYKCDSNVPGLGWPELPPQTGTDEIAPGVGPEELPPPGPVSDYLLDTGGYKSKFYKTRVIGKVCITYFKVKPKYDRDGTCGMTIYADRNSGVKFYANDDRSPMQSGNDYGDTFTGFAQYYGNILSFDVSYFHKNAGREVIVTGVLDKKRVDYNKLGGDQYDEIRLAFEKDDNL